MGKTTDGCFLPDPVTGRYPEIHEGDFRTWLIKRLIGKRPVVMNCIIHTKLASECDTALDADGVRGLIFCNNTVSETQGPAPIVMRPEAKNDV